MSADVSYSLFLMLDPFRESSRPICGRIPAWVYEDRYLIGAAAFYHPAQDSVVVALQFQPELARALGGPGMEALMRACSVPMIASTNLTAADRRNFLGKLASYPYQIQIAAEPGHSVDIITRSIQTVLGSVARVA
jgi:hypothetical protein